VTITPSCIPPTAHRRVNDPPSSNRDGNRNSTSTPLPHRVRNSCSLAACRGGPDVQPFPGGGLAIESADSRALPSSALGTSACTRACTPAGTLGFARATRSRTRCWLRGRDRTGSHSSRTHCASRVKRTAAVLPAGACFALHRSQSCDREDALLCGQRRPSYLARGRKGPTAQHLNPPPGDEERGLATSNLSFAQHVCARDTCACTPACSWCISPGSELAARCGRDCAPAGTHHNGTCSLCMRSAFREIRREAVRPRRSWPHLVALVLGVRRSEARQRSYVSAG
jgi:hypothetical protein